MSQEQPPSLNEFPKPIRDQVMKILRTAAKRRKGQVEEASGQQPGPRL
ncbi:hypothetical protein [Alicyclobacillus fastidiosus]|uniref:Uncharacterized protein n=1 Tax=Alicyclobacillus fastidiosus TaxID=392011 RepID=A0ABV5ACS2_9BACL